MKHNIRNIISAALLITAITSIAAEKGKILKIDLKTAPSKGAKPLIAVWLETNDGKFVQTLQRFGKKTRYFKTLTGWKVASKSEDKKTIDAVTSATIKWNKSASLKLPIKTETYDLSKGGYVIRIESRAEKKKHHKLFKIPAGSALKGGTFTHDGHITEVITSVE